MTSLNKTAVCAGALLGLASSGFSLAGNPVVQAPFDSQYQLGLVAGSLAEIPVSYSAPAFLTGDPDTLVFAGHSYYDDAGGQSVIYAVGVNRDAGGHIISLAGSPGFFAHAPGLPATGAGVGAGLAAAPGGVLVYASPVDSSLGMIKSGSPAADKHIALLQLSPVPIAEGAGLAIVPADFGGAGKLKLATLSGEFFSASLSADGAGLFDVTNVQDIGPLTGLPTGPQGGRNYATGIGYVAAGNPLFAQASVISSSCDFYGGENSDLVAYDADGNGDPVLSTARIVVHNLCATGLAVDPVTGDLLFTDFYGFPALAVLRGFTVPRTAPAVSIGATPATIRLGQSTRLDWSSSHATDCGASSGAWSGAKQLSGSEMVEPAGVGPATYGIVCSAPAQSGGSSVTATVARGVTALNANAYLARNSLLKFSGTLTNASASPARPVAGRMIRFSAGTVSCNGFTNAQGYAECTTKLAQLAISKVLLNQGYSASFEGDTSYEPSGTRGPILVVYSTRVGGD